nr:unnamed protein product [Spirometra erinaceieuropaei]
MCRKFKKEVVANGSNIPKAKAIRPKVPQTILPLLMNPGQMPATSRAVESEPEKRRSKSCLTLSFGTAAVDSAVLRRPPGRSPSLVCVYVGGLRFFGPYRGSLKIGESRWDRAMLDEILDRLVKAIEKLSSNRDLLPKPEKLTIYDDYDLWEDRMNLHLESVSEGNRSLAILGQLDSEVYAVARAASITPSLTTATIFERIRREFGRSSMPRVARATLTDRRQHSGESVVDSQRHLRVLAKHAYPDDSCAALEDRIRDNFVDGVANPDIRRKFMLDPPKTLKAALDIARDDSALD